MYRQVRSAATRSFPYLLLGAGLMSLLLFGLLGQLRGELRRHLDLETLYSGGVMLWRGIVPYGPPSTLPEVAAQGIKTWIYAYPPNFSPVALLLAAPTYQVTTWAVMIANLLALAGIVHLVLAMMREPAPGVGSWAVPSQAVQLAAVGAILLSPFVAHVMWLGNTTLMVAAALLAGWQLNATGRPVVAGICLALASVKPQLLLLPGLWLLLERQWTTIASAAVASLVLCSYSMAVYGPVGAFTDWIGGIRFYLTSFENDAGCIYCFGIGDLMAAGNIQAHFVEVLVVVGIGVVWLWRHQLSRLEIIALINMLTVLFLPVHNYDLVMLAPVVGALAALVASRMLAAAVAVAAMVTMYVPLRFVALLEHSLLLRWRELLMLALCVLILLLAERRSALYPMPLARKT